MIEFNFFSLFVPWLWLFYIHFSHIGCDFMSNIRHIYRLWENKIGIPYKNEREIWRDCTCSWLLILSTQNSRSFFIKLPFCSKIYFLHLIASSLYLLKILFIWPEDRTRGDSNDMGGLKHALNRSSTQLSHDFLVVFTAGDGQTGRVPQERVLAAHQTGSRDQQHTGWRGVLRTGLFMNRPIAEVF